MTRREAALIVFKLRDIKYGRFDLSVVQAVDLILQSVSGVQFHAEDIEASDLEYNVSDGKENRLAKSGGANGLNHIRNMGMD
jgi:hypothetical protein